MDWKSFISPSWMKVALFLALALPLFFINWSDCPGCPDAFSYQGFPLPVYYSGGFSGYAKTFTSIYSVLADVVIWYLLSIILATGINTLRKV